MENPKSRTLFRLTLFTVALGLAAWLAMIVGAKLYQPMRMIDWKERERGTEEDRDKIHQMMRAHVYKIGIKKGRERFKNGSDLPNDEELKKQGFDVLFPMQLATPVNVRAYVKGFRSGYKSR